LNQLRKRFAELEVVPRIADITDRARMKRVFEEARPDVLLHAAAHKHVPMMECSPGEGPSAAPQDFYRPRAAG